MGGSKQLDVICTCPLEESIRPTFTVPLSLAANRFGAVEEGGMDGRRSNQQACRKLGRRFRSPITQSFRSTLEK